MGCRLKDRSEPHEPAKREGHTMLFFGRKKRLIDYASCAG